MFLFLEYHEGTTYAISSHNFMLHNEKQTVDIIWASCSLTLAFHSIWVHDPRHHHRQLYRVGFGAAPSRRGQNTHVQKTGELHMIHKHSHNS